MFGLAIVAALSHAQADDSATVLQRNDWSLGVSPYVWAASLEGTAGVAGMPSLEIHASFDDIMQHLDSAAMALVELRYRRFGIDADTRPEIPFDNDDIRTELFIGTFGGAYRVLEGERGHLDLLGGARIWSVDTRVNLAGDREFESNQNWTDPVIGFKGRFNLGHGFFCNGAAHTGGFGATSDLTWDVFGGIGYQFNHTISAQAGYRHLAVEYDRGDFKFDVELSGPVIGATIRF